MQEWTSLKDEFAPEDPAPPGEEISWLKRPRSILWKLTMAAVCLFSAGTLFMAGFLFLLVLLGASFGTLDIEGPLDWLFGFCAALAISSFWLIFSRPGKASSKD